MRLSKRGEYGLRAMIALAEPAEKGKIRNLMQIKDIAVKEQTSPKFWDLIFLALKNAELFHSKMGFSGEYYLAGSASEITVDRFSA